ncbi:hypothetical protein FEM48_Zijuj01G0132500 [Ziziphus jujuba var. spinosa]|uniref:Retrotransposon gag domain-containing protein n=1 Tax=Ziziphus jujuba var. spinosa TaxID=714518 RepID=A0A978W1G8_ZIZJJ|nr:hypothetical protein FEM48_Zijuj01G0132500 [Ziziphus jujuba var. spinosa]
MEEEFPVLRRSSHSTPSSSVETLPSKIKVPYPKPFNGARDVKELENFLLDMEQYFNASHCPYHEKVMVTSMYLTGDDKLWWQTHLQDDDNANILKIQTWEVLKKELKDQFLPCNTAWVARESLKKLKYMGNIQDYVKEFSSLMLDIKNMSEENKLFNFFSGLQGRAQAGLRRQGVKTLPAAFADADGLLDFKYMGSSSSSNDNNKKKNGDGKKSKGGKNGNRWRKQKEDESSKSKKTNQFEVTLMPYKKGIVISGGMCPCFVECTLAGKVLRKKQQKTISTLQFKNGLKKCVDTFVAALLEIKPD